MPLYNFRERAAVIEEKVFKLVTDFHISFQKQNGDFFQQLDDEVKAVLSSEELTSDRKVPSTSGNNTGKEDIDKENQVEGPLRRSSLRKASQEAQRQISNSFKSVRARSSRRPLADNNIIDNFEEPNSDDEAESAQLRQPKGEKERPTSSRASRSQKSTAVCSVEEAPVDPPQPRRETRASRQAQRMVQSAPSADEPVVKVKPSTPKKLQNSQHAASLPSKTSALQSPPARRTTRSQLSSIGGETQGVQSQTTKRASSCKQATAASTSKIGAILEEPALLSETANPLSALEKAQTAQAKANQDGGNKKAADLDPRDEAVALNAETLVTETVAMQGAVSVVHAPQAPSKGSRCRTKVICKGLKTATYALPIVEGVIAPTTIDSPQFVEQDNARNSAKHLAPTQLENPVQEPPTADVSVETQPVDHGADKSRRKSRKSLRESLQSLQRTSDTLTQIFAKKSLMRAKRISLAKAKRVTAEEDSSSSDESFASATSSDVKPKQPLSSRNDKAKRVSTKLEQPTTDEFFVSAFSSGVKPKQPLSSRNVALKQTSSKQLASKAKSKRSPSANKYTPRVRANSATEGGSFLPKQSAKTLGLTGSVERIGMEERRRLLAKDEALRNRLEELRAKVEKMTRTAKEKAKRVQAARQTMQEQKKAANQAKLSLKEEKSSASAQKLKEKRAKEILRRKQLAEARRLEAERRRQLEEQKAAEVVRQQRKEAKREALKKEMEFKQKQLQKEREKYQNAMKKLVASSTSTTVTSVAEENCVICVPATAENYVMTPKGVKYLNNNTSHDYGIQDLSSDDSTDNEEMPRKHVPQWAQGEQLHRAVSAQSVSPPMLDEIFPPHELLKSLRLEAIFKNGRIRRIKRTSSAIWDTPPSYKSLLQSRESF